MNEYQAVLFEEKQRFPLWLHLVSLTGMVIGIVVMSYVLFYKLKEQFPVFMIVIMFVMFLLGPIFLWMFKMQTQVREDGLYVKVFPLTLWFKKFGFNEIKKFYVRQYSPLREYGGWGIRWSRGGKTYNMCGNKGVQLVLENSKKILIGSQKAKELEEAINSAKQDGFPPARE